MTKQKKSPIPKIPVPRGPHGPHGHAGPQPPKKGLTIGYILLALLLLYLFLYGPLMGKIPSKEISYSAFKKMITQGEFSEVIIGETKLRGEILDPQTGKATTAYSTPTLDDKELIPTLEKYNVVFSAEPKTPILNTLISWVIPLALLFIVWMFLMRRLARMGPGPGVMSFGKTRAKLLAEEEIQTTFNDVAGVDEAKEELLEVIDFLKNPKKYTSLGGKIPKGILLVGPPGTGKTLLARAVAGEAGVPFFSLSGSDFVEMFVGVGAARVRDLFNQAATKAPCIIFIDELDAIGKARGIAGPIGGHDEREQTLNQLLVEMDGFDARKGIIIVAATNRPEILDPALLRPGRFDRQILVDRPDLKEREAILKIHARDVKLSPSVELRKIAAATPGFVGADLANLVNESALLAVRRGKHAIDMNDLNEAVERIMAGLEKKNRVINAKEKDIVAHHETGHALVAILTNHPDQVHKISIVPRGISALGYTLQVPTEDRYLMTKTELLAKVDILLGGRAAEVIMYDEISTGAQNDLRRATDIARSMVMDYGMSEKLGNLTFGEEKRPYMVGGFGFPTHKEYSEATAEIIDSEVKRFIDERTTFVLDLIRKNKDKLIQVGKILLERETIDGDQFRRVMAGESPETVFKEKEEEKTGS